MQQNIDFFQFIKLKWILECNVPHFVECFLITNCAKTAEVTFLDEYKLKLWKINNVDAEKLYPDISYIIQTSGTTGTSKTVSVGCNCIMSNINSFRYLFFL